MQKFKVVCYDCGKAYEMEARTKTGLYEVLRCNGWGLSYGNAVCYCPNSAPFRRNVGRSGKRREAVQTSIDVTAG